MFVVVVFALGLMGDPAGTDPLDPPPPPLPHVVVVDLQPLGVPDETAQLATRLVVVGLRERLKTHEVRYAAELSPDKRQQAESCANPACWKELARQSKAALVVHGTLGRLGTGLVLTLDADSGERVGGRVHVVEQAADPAVISPMIDRTVELLVTRLQRDDADEPATTTKPTTKPPPTTTKPDLAAATPAGAPNDDLVLLALNYGLMFIPVVGTPFLLPLVQGLVMKEGGAQLARNEYPNWWHGTAAGYGVFAVGGATVITLYVSGVVLANTGGDPLPAIALILGALAVGAVTWVAEPAVVWFVARTDARPVDESLDQGGRAALDTGLTPMALLGLSRSSSSSSSSSFVPTAYGLGLR